MRPFSSASVSSPYVSGCRQLTRWPRSLPSASHSAASAALLSPGVTDGTTASVSPGTSPSLTEGEVSMSVHRFAPEPRQPRSVCARCRRPQTVCYCAALPRLETTTKIVILQHPRERDMPIGTARMASLCLPAAELHVGVRWSESPALARALGDPARPPILLYPGPGARDILREPPPGPATLVVVDGTWSQAKTVVRDTPVLQALPRYAFATPEPSQYRIRREPRAEYVSTIEALMHVLGVLEGDPPRFRSLLDPLNAMVDSQLACQARSARRRVRHPRAPRPPG